MSRRSARDTSRPSWPPLQAHSCVKKACMIGGITHCRLIRTHAEDEWALNPAAVAAVNSCETI